MGYLMGCSSTTVLMFVDEEFLLSIISHVLLGCLGVMLGTLHHAAWLML